MKLVFVYYAYENQGSSLDLQGYARAAREMGHEAVVYGAPNPKIRLNYSIDLSGADAVIFVFEWTTDLLYGDRLDWLRLVSSVPRRRRVVIDCDGRYNDLINVHGDFNHRTEAESTSYVDFCDAVADKIYQPTPRPLRRNVGTFLFHIYDPTWEAPLDFSAKDFSIVYVGHSKFRWHGMSQMLRAVAPVRGEVGRIGLFGYGWDKQPDWAETLRMEDVYRVDYDYMKELRVEAIPPVPFAQVISTMSRGSINPVVYRPLFEHLGFVTCRTFENVAAGTIPLFLLNADYVRGIFGDAAADNLMLAGDRQQDKVVDVLRRPQHYAEIVQGIRREFRQRHTPEARLRQLIEIIEE
jgi:glycosyltransferase involved in cell wall biosynthesis